MYLTDTSAYKTYPNLQKSEVQSERIELNITDHIKAITSNNNGKRQRKIALRRPWNNRKIYILVNEYREVDACLYALHVLCKLKRRMCMCVCACVLAFVRI